MKKERDLYMCEECGMKYKTSKLAKKCEDFCKKYKSCSLEIIKEAVN
jgi:predicted ATP-dependent serine protease